MRQLQLQRVLFNLLITTDVLFVQVKFLFHYISISVPFYEAKNGIGILRGKSIEGLSIRLPY